MRLDQKLVDLGLCPTRSKAQDLIKKEGVLVEKPGSAEPQLIFKPSFEVNEAMSISLQGQETLKYVSRAGLKMERALDHLQLSVEQKLVLDLGQSTGGFTHCLLERGAQRVVGIEVGQGQIHPQLQKDPRVVTFEKTNAKDLGHLESFIEYKNSFDLVVMDVSFVSMTHFLDTVLWAIKTQGRLLSLVKPQFELDANHLNKKGIVKAPSSYDIVEGKIRQALAEKGFTEVQYFESQWPGKDGNREFFVYAKV